MKTSRFNPRTPCGVRPPWRLTADSSQKFQSTHSLRSATDAALTRGAAPAVSIHALLAECDAIPEAYRSCLRGFNPRTPCGVRPTTMARRTPPPWFQSTHSLRSATLQGHCRSQDFQVSIHALLAECDRWHVPHLITLLVSIHALLAECDWCFGVFHSQCCFWFQSTHSLRSATSCFSVRPASQTGFNPRTPCGVRLMAIWSLNRTVRFQSTHSLRSATLC